MVDGIYEAIASWAGVSTWHTSHPLDEARFNGAISNLVAVVGSDITTSQFEEALRRHAGGNTPTLGEPNEWDSLIEKHTEKAMTIISYEADRGVR